MTDSTHKPLDPAIVDKLGLVMKESIDGAGVHLDDQMIPLGLALGLCTHIYMQVIRDRGGVVADGQPKEMPKLNESEYARFERKLGNALTAAEGILDVMIDNGVVQMAAIPR